MKHAKKLASLLLALVMVFALATTAFAAQEGTLTSGSITINDAVPGQIYKAYQILYLESYNKDSGAYAYKANSAWETWLRTQTSYVSFDAQGYVTWVKDADPAAFAKLAQAEATKEGSTITADATATAPAAAEGATYSTVKFENLKLGYYLVDTTLGTLCSLDTTNPDVVMEEKNEVPTNVKTVEEDSTGNYGVTNDADIGQTVNFKSTITAQKGAENYVFHDTMSSGLTLDKTSIKVNNVAVTDAQGNDVSGDNYTVSYPSGEGADGCTFEIAFAQSYLDTITQATEITITYSATLNENAVVGLPGNPNTSKLSYGEIDSTTNEPSGTTPPSTTTTYTWDVDVFKYANKTTDEDGDTKTVEIPLADATFTLSKNDDGSNPIALVAEGNNVYRVAKTGETGTVTEITTDTTGKFTIKGLDADTYYLTETKAPSGYNKPSDPITIVIGENGVVNGTTEAPQGVDEVKVLNQSGTELPSTGGMGTTIFYVVGSVLVLAAVVLLVTKKRMSAKG